MKQTWILLILLLTIVGCKNPVCVETENPIRAMIDTRAWRPEIKDSVYVWYKEGNYLGMQLPPYNDDRQLIVDFGTTDGIYCGRELEKLNEKVKVYYYVVFTCSPTGYPTIKPTERGVAVYQGPTLGWTP